MKKVGTNYTERPWIKHRHNKWRLSPAVVQFKSGYSVSMPALLTVPLVCFFALAGVLGMFSKNDFQKSLLL
jgi:hypothetical protein